MKTRTVTLHVGQDGLFSDGGYVVDILDDGEGEYVRITETGWDTASSGIGVCAQSWPALRDSIDRMIAEIRE